jgi:hypothetical protein
MKKLLLLLAFTAIQFSNAQAPTAIWQKCYGGTNDDNIGAIITTTDGGYLIGLSTRSNDGDISGNHGDEDVSILKLNATGVVQWQKCYGGTGQDFIKNFFQTSDGGFLIVAQTNSNDGDVSGNHGAFTGDLWITKINAIGIILWQKCIGGNQSEYLEEIIPTSDGGFIGFGKTTSINNGDVLGNTAVGAWVFKINDLGVIQWQKVYQDVRITSVLQTPDGGYIYSGEGMFSNLLEYHGGFDVWVAKVNQGGNIQWQKCYGGSGTEEYSKIIASNDGGYFFTSRTFSNDGVVYGNHGSVDCWVVKLDASGIILEQNCYGGSGDEGGGYIQETLDSGILVMSSTNSNDGNVSGNHGGRDVWSIKLSSTGAIQWQKCFGGTNDDYGVAFQLADGTYIVGGTTYSNNGDISGNHNTTSADGFLTKLTADNLATENFENKDIKYYPNPMQNVLHIDYDNKFSRKITDLAGKILMNVNTKDIDVSSLSAGIYLLDIVSDDKHYVSKIVKE